MNPGASAPDAADEDFLDRAYERAVLLLEEGSDPALDEILNGREHLRPQVEELLDTARVATTVQPRRPPAVPGYTVLSEIGRGGMGTVWLARQEALGGRCVALKILPGAAALASSARERFLAEARALAAVRHPNVVPIYDVVSGSDVQAYAMEWVDGLSLARLIAHLRNPTPGGVPADAAPEPRMDLARLHLGTLPAGAATTWTVFVCRLGIAVARAVAALHRAGLVHRDVKPSNILLRSDGTPLLSDFGLAHEAEAELTRSGHFAGTVAYASPEQLAGGRESLNARADVYALGVTLYHALTLRLPYDAVRGGSRLHDAPAAMLHAIESGRMVPLRTRNRRLPRDLETIVAKAMDPDPLRRYGAAEELAEDLERLLELRPIRARPAGFWSRSVKLLRRNRAAAFGVAAGTFLSLALAASALVWFFFLPRWAAEQVREARLLLLHPDQANAVFVAEFRMRNFSSDRKSWLQVEALRRAQPLYDAALRWAPEDPAAREERDVVAALLDGAARAPGSDPDLEAPEIPSGARAEGIAAFLAGDVGRALDRLGAAEALRRPGDNPDPLVEGALGILHLVRDAPARAYPRLREACRMIPGVGFLTTYQTDAAVGCGDYAAAERLLDAANSMPGRDQHEAWERVRADLCAATGRDTEAEALYSRFPAGTPGSIHYARFLAAAGRLEESIERYLGAFSVLGNDRLAAEYARTLDRWWAGLSGRERLSCLRSAMDPEFPYGRSVAFRLRVLHQVRRDPEDSNGIPGEPPPAAGEASVFTGLTNLLPFFLTPFERFPSPFLQNVPLEELADVLEVENMSRWSAIRNYPPVLKLVQMLIWMGPWPRRLSESLETLYQAAIRSKFRAAAALALTVTVVGHSAPAQLFADKAAFMAATGATPAHPPLPNVGPIPGDASGTYSIGSVTFSISPNSTALHVGAHPYGPTWSSLLPGNLIAISDEENLNVQLAAPVHSLGFDFVEPAPGGDTSGFACSVGCPCVDTTFDLTLKLGGMPVGLYQFNAPDSVAAFVGVWSSVPFDRVEIRDLAHACDDEYFGQFYSGMTAPCTAAPTASAGHDASVTEGALVMRDGSGSSSPCGAPLYAWSQIAGPPVLLSDASAAAPSFFAPAVPAGGATLTFELLVSDGLRTSAADIVNIAVTNVNNPPVALAGDDQIVNEGSSVALDGSASYDLDAEPLTFTWLQTAGPSVVLNLSDPVRPSFTAPLVGPVGAIIVFELAVSDGIGVGLDSVEVAVENVNHAPAADAGVDETVAGGAAIALDGSGSQDPDGDALGYLWIQVSGPSVVLAGDATAAATFTAPAVGPGGATLVFRLSVTDGLGGLDDDEVTVTVQGSNAPPVCHLARPSVAELWPPNHKLVPVTIQGVTHPENQAVTITITGVTQDEPINGLGDGDTAPDAVIQGGTVLLRAERAGGGNGRVYRVSFLASDGLGGTCSGQVLVCVPKSKGKNVPPCVDDGQIFNSLGP